MLNLTDFMAELRHRGTHSTNRFTVTITPPQGLLSLNSRKLSLRALDTVLPGRTIMTKDDIVRFGYGLIDKVGHNTIFSDVPVAFIVDSRHQVTEMIDRWMLLINNANQLADSEVDDNRYLVSYKDDYATDIVITQYNNQGYTTAKCTLREAFPIVRQDIRLGWQDNDQIAILPVVFTYTDYKLEFPS